MPEVIRLFLRYLWTHFMRFYEPICMKKVFNCLRNKGFPDLIVRSPSSNSVYIGSKIAINHRISSKHPQQNLSNLNQPFKIIRVLNGGWNELMIDCIKMITFVGLDEVVGGHFGVEGNDRGKILNQVLFLEFVLTHFLEYLYQKLIYFACIFAFVGG